MDTYYRLEPAKLRVLLLSGLGLGAWLVFGPVLAVETQAGESLNTIDMGMGLLGGLALFLFGMEQMGDGLKAAAGDRMKDILAKLTRTRIAGAITGALVTAVIQSSSVTTVLVVGFVSAGLMNLTQSVGIIMGANIGTTITGQIVAFKVEKAALLMIAVGFAMLFFARQDKLRHYGGILMGLGLVFFGMGVMSDAMHPLRSYPPFLDLMASMDNPLLAILVAATFTALVQSSSATTGIVIIMASQGFVSLGAGIALALGANVGTCITAMLASAGKSREAIRTAVVHVLFNVLGVLLWLGFIDQLAALTTALSPVSPELTGTARLAADTPRQIANANTLFNVVNTVVFLGFAGVFARLATRLVPDKPVDERLLIAPKFLDEELIATPAFALERVRMELGHLGELVLEIFNKAPEAIVSGEVEPLEQLAKMDDKVDLLESEILAYLGQIRRRELSESESADFVALMQSTDSLERIGDVLETDVVNLAKKRIELGLEASETMRAMLSHMHATVGTAIELAVRAIRDEDQQAAQQAVGLKGEIERSVAEALTHQASKLGEDSADRLPLFRLEMELVEKLRLIYALARHVALNVLPAELAAHAES